MQLLGALALPLFDTSPVVFFLAVFAVFVVSSLGYLVTGSITRWRERGWRRRLGRVVDDFSVVLFDGAQEGADAFRRIASLSRHRLLEAVQPLAIELRGLPVERLQMVVQATGLERRLRRAARSRSWRRRYQAAQLHYLITDLAFDRVSLLDDAQPLVRMAAVESLTPEQAARHIGRLITMLGDPSPSCRETAVRALLRLGPGAVMALDDAIGQGGVIGHGALEIAAQLGDTSMLGRVARYSDSAVPQERALAAAALGRGAGLRDDSSLLRMLGDEDKAVRCEAAIALGRLGARLRAPQIAALLRDPEWDARRAAGWVLAGLGPAGLLQLRVMLRSDDRYARDMARQSLEDAAVRSPRLLPPRQCEDDLTAFWAELTAYSDQCWSRELEPI